jgi:hypothetical protein
LPSCEKKILVGHNIKTYDCLVLTNALQNCDLLTNFHAEVAGYMDTLKLFKVSCPNLKSYSQVNLSKSLLGSDFQYAAHDAMEDVKTLKQLVNLPSVTSESKTLCGFSTDYVLKSVSHNCRVKYNIPSLQIIISRKVISASMGRKIAGSGLNFAHLKTVYRRSGEDGIFSLLSESVDGQTRVTKSRKVVEGLCGFLSSLPEQ